MADEENPLALLGTSVLCLAAIVFILRKFSRTKGKKLLNHVLFVVVATVTLSCVPDFIQNTLFSPTGVLIIGTLVPIYESIRAVCTIEASDDEEWLQYWLASAAFTHCTEWMDIVAEHFPTVHEHWYELEFFVLLWMLLPFTDGSALIYKKITEPYIVPLAESVKEKVEGKAVYILLLVNTGYIWILWFVFMNLEEEAKRFIVVAAGTVYPLAVSILSLSKDNNSYGITTWLTYWSCFSVLFLMMDYLENFVGEIRGFYSICLCATVYLFLPMFNGADAVFRNILVPLAGQQEQLFLRDVDIMKIEAMTKIPAEAHDAIFAKASILFQKKSKDI